MSSSLPHAQLGLLPLESLTMNVHALDPPILPQPILQSYLQYVVLKSDVITGEPNENATPSVGRTVPSEIALTSLNHL